MNLENNNHKKNLSQEEKLIYRGLVGDVNGLEESNDLGIQTMESLGVILEKANDLDLEFKFEERVSCTEHTLVDSKVVSHSSSILVKCMKNANFFNSIYEAADFNAKCIKELHDSEEDFAEDRWLNILQDVRQLIPDQLDNCSVLYGAFDPTKIPEKKQREHIKRCAQRAERRVPRVIEKVEKDKKSTEEMVLNLEKEFKNIYKNNNLQPLNYMDFVIDSESFVSTVENMFNCSFLIENGKARLTVGKDGELILQPESKATLSTSTDKRDVTEQGLIYFTMDDWEAMRKEGHIQKYRKRERSE